MEGLDIKSVKKELKIIKVFAMPLGIVILLVFLLIKLFLPKTQAAYQQLDQLEQNKIKIDQLQKKMQILNQFNKDKLVLLIEKSKVLLPADDDPVNLIIHLQELKNNTGVDLGGFNLNLNSESGIPGVKAVNFSIITKETKDKTFRFLEELASPQELILKITDISENIGQGPSEEMRTYNLRLQLVSYYCQFPKKIGSIEEKIPEISSEQKKIIERLALIALPPKEEMPSGTENFNSRENPFVF